MVYTGLETVHLVLVFWDTCLGLIFFLPVAFSRECDSRRIGTELKRNPYSCRLEKAECLEVREKYQPPNNDRPGVKWFEGTFVARDGVRYVTGRKPHPGNCIIKCSNEQRMLGALVSTNLRPLSDTRVAESCETPGGLRTEYASLIRWAGISITQGARESGAHFHPASGDCLLFLGGIRGAADATEGPRVVSTYNRQLFVLVQQKADKDG